MSTLATTRNRMSIQTIAKVSILGALAFLVMMFEIALPFAPSFYKLGFDEVIVLIGGFALGPWAAVCIEALKIALNLIIGGTITMGIGELTNFLIGLAFVVPATLIYQKNKSRKNAIKGLMIGTISLTVIGALLNYFVMLPAFAFFMNIPMDKIIEMGHIVNPNINGLLGLVLFATTPFNLLKGIMSSVVVLLCYKKISPIIKKQ